jgi:glycosyltransferase involved in cell wall biosynthesis
MSRLVVIIPAFDEEQSIANVIKNVPPSIKGIDEIKIVVIDDGSTDSTAEVAKVNGVEVISHPHNLGLGVTFRRGISRALELDADVIVNIDADGQFNPQDIPLIVAPVIEGKAEFVTASRFMSKDPDFKLSILKRMGNRMMSWIISGIVGKKYFDVSCGFRAYSRKAALRMNLFGKFTYTQETFIDLAYKDIPIVEVPVKVRSKREFGKSKISSNLFKYGFQTMKIIIMAFRDYKPFKLMGIISLVFAVFGVAVGGFFLVHYIRAGEFRPHTWAGFLSGTFLALALLFLIAGVFMEMFSRMRINQERLLYLARKRFYDSKNDE